MLQDTHAVGWGYRENGERVRAYRTYPTCGLRLAKVGWVGQPNLCAYLLVRIIMSIENGTRAKIINSPGEQFEHEIIDFFGDILKVEIISQYPVGKIYIADLFFHFGNHDYIVEVKYYRTPLAQMSLLMRAAQQIVNAAQQIVNAAQCTDKPTKPVLVVACYVSSNQRKVFEEAFPDLILIDRLNLLNTSKDGIFFNSSLLLDSEDSMIPYNSESPDLIACLSRN